MPTPDQIIDAADRLFAAITDGDVEVLDRQVFDGGFVQRHILDSATLRGEQVILRVGGRVQHSNFPALVSISAHPR
ncbi:hypothetical protein [Mycolicibacterium sarraceniae]|uniref:Uncharacterized protein n=1 Tax=Mycolicibacterium sarraceniae TaxID=1534348 RepID=A0A7I7SLL2_9MYCO|nr:hypothetical protein [Mycolicibacterium sarraceniae]BBY57099.1 hypothetical protein MSAR_02350 [Mycolicibacterium sarraceniae]